MLMSLVSTTARVRRRPPGATAAVAFPPPHHQPGAADGTIQFRETWLDAGFTSVPNLVLRSRRLNSTAKVVYGLLLSYAWEKDHTWPGQHLIAAHLDATTRTVRNALTDLKAAGLISVEQRGLRQTNVYWIEPLATFAAAEKPERRPCSPLPAAGQRAMGAAELLVGRTPRFQTDRKNVSGQERQSFAGLERQRSAAESNSREKDPEEQQQLSVARAKEGAGEDVVALLLTQGVTKRIAQHLLTTHGDAAVRLQLAYAPYRNTTSNPAGALVKAIAEDWAPPAAYLEAQQREAARIRHAVEAEQRARAAAAEDERRRQEIAAWESLSPEEKAEQHLPIWRLRIRTLEKREPTSEEEAARRAALIAEFSGQTEPRAPRRHPPSLARWEPPPPRLATRSAALR
jgi:hypothetical protein